MGNELALYKARIIELEASLEHANRTVTVLLPYKKANVANTNVFTRIIDDTREFLEDNCSDDVIGMTHVRSFFERKILHIINTRARNPDAEDL